MSGHAPAEFATALQGCMSKITNCFIKIQYRYNLKDRFMASTLLEKHE